MRLEAREFNRMAEAFYREKLRCRHLREAIAHMREDISELERSAVGEVRGALRHGVRIQDPERFLASVEERIVSDQLSLHETSSLLNLMILLSCRDRLRTAQEKP